jgi:uncharacterized damage-inducible protein DinB
MYTDDLFGKRRFMTYYGSKQLADSFRTVRNNTIAIAEEIPEDKYGFKATPEVMSVGEMLAHVAVTPSWQIDIQRRQLTHIDFAMFAAHRQQAENEEKALRTKADIVRALTEGREQFATFVETFDEAALASLVTFPPPVQPGSKTRFEMLLGVKEHEMHHRGQLMLLQRLLGQVPPLTRRRQQQMQAQAAQAASR